MTHKESNSIITNGVDANEEIYMFDRRILEDLDLNDSEITYQPEISIESPGQGLYLRPLCLTDFDKDYLQVLQQLTIVGNVTREMFTDTFLSMRSCPNTYYIIVIEDLNTEKIVGSVTLLTEHKFIHSAGLRGRIEDVVVKEEYRGRQLGKLLVDTAYRLAQKLECYKLSLDCKEKIKKFYQSFGFQQEDVNMLIKRFKD